MPLSLRNQRLEISTRNSRQGRFILLWPHCEIEKPFRTKVILISKALCSLYYFLLCVTLFSCSPLPLSSSAPPLPFPSLYHIGCRIFWNSSTKATNHSSYISLNFNGMLPRQVILSFARNCIYVLTYWPLEIQKWIISLSVHCCIELGSLICIIEHWNLHRY